MAAVVEFWQSLLPWGFGHGSVLGLAVEDNRMLLSHKGVTGAIGNSNTLYYGFGNFLDFRYFKDVLKKRMTTNC